MQKIKVLLLCVSMGFILISCVTTVENTEDSILQENRAEDTVKETVAEDSDKSKEKNGIIYNSRELAEGPLLLGSTEHLEGPIVEFNIL